MSYARAVWWTWTALRATRRDLREHGLQARVLPPPSLPWAARRGVLAVLDRVDPTCLERAMVLQAWLSAHGRHHDVVVGVARAEGEFKAHAWVEAGPTPADAADFREIHRIRP